MKTLLLTLLSLIPMAQRCAPPPNLADGNESEIQAEWLRNIRTTARISSNHYSDFVMDSADNSYIACFFAEQGVDYVYIVKVSPAGDIIWEIDGPNEGRATAIAIDGQERIWVTGFFQNSFEIGGKSTFAAGGELFLAQLDGAGKCHQLITGKGGAVGYNLCVNPQGRLLLAGTRGLEMTIGERTLEASQEGGFVAIFEADRNCISLQNLPGQPTRFRSDPAGNFYACGQFHDSFHVGKTLGQTQNSYDRDGFLLKLDANGKLLWFRQYGKAGNDRYGYRSGEGFSDLVISPKGEVLVAGASELDYPHSPALLMPGTEKSLKAVVVTFGPDGDVLQEKMIAQGTSEGSVHTFARSPKGNFYLTFVCDNNARIVGLPPLEFADKSKSVLLKFGPDWQLTDHQLPADGTDAVFRNSFVRDSAIHFSGHYRGAFDFANNKVENDGQHGLYLLRVLD